MRNIDYRALYEKIRKNQDAVDPKKRRGTYDNLTHDERTNKAIDGNKQRTLSVKLGEKGIGTGKRGVSPVEPANLKVVDEELETIKGVLIDHIAEMSNDELWDLVSILEASPARGFNI